MRWLGNAINKKTCIDNTKLLVFLNVLRDTRHFFRNFLIIFQHSLLVTLHTSPSDAPTPVIRQNSTRCFSLQNNCSLR